MGVATWENRKVPKLSVSEVHGVVARKLLVFDEVTGHMIYKLSTTMLHRKCT